MELARAFVHPLELIEDRKYELQDTICTKKNVPNWNPTIDVIEHIKQWKEENT
jgi:hypothetical protein